MTVPYTKTIKKNIDYWWLYLLSGLLLTGAGIWISISPAAAYVSLSILFAIGILLTGILETIFAVTASRSLHGWGWTLAGGVLDMVIGSYLLTYPLLTMQVLPFIVGFWLLFRGISAIGFSFDMKSYHVGKWWLLLVLSILILIFGFMILAVPAFGILNIIIWTALSFISAGGFRILLAFKLRELSN